MSCSPDVKFGHFKRSAEWVLRTISLAPKELVLRFAVYLIVKGGVVLKETLLLCAANTPVGTHCTQLDQTVTSRRGNEGFHTTLIERLGGDAVFLQ